jgi:hypothetical protein
MKSWKGIVVALLAAVLAGAPLCRAGTPTEAQQAAEALQTHGVTGTAAERIRTAIEACESEGLPAEPLRTRLLEGLAKRAAPDALAAAVDARLAALRSARDMIRAAGYGDPAEPSHGELLASTARAVESGVPAADLATVLSRGEGGSGGRMQTIVESGESLTLAGVDAATVRAFMMDCLDRNLRRMEMLRAARFSIQQHRGGMNGAEIRRALWGDDASQPLPLRGQGTGRGGPGGGPMGPPAGASASPAGHPGPSGSAGTSAGSTSPGPTTAPGSGPAGASSPGAGSSGTASPGGAGPGGAGGSKR